MYNAQDLSVFAKNIDNLKKQLQENRNKYLVPSYDYLKKIEVIIFDYIREKKRKIYGGFAQNQLIIQKKVADRFYDPEEIVDIDFYSPDPVQDIINLCNKFHDLKLENIMGSEAQHAETYTIFVEFEKVCDISYVPMNVYSRIPFVEIDGIHYCGPHFMMIDLYRAFTDPIVSGIQRWEKTFPRILTLQKHYPFPQVSKKIPLPIIKSESTNDTEITSIVHNILHNLANKKSVIIFGSYAYNCYLQESKLLNDKNNDMNNFFNYLDNNYIELVSNDYINDVKSIYNNLHTDIGQRATNLSVTEFHRFWILTGYSCIIYYKNIPICRIIDYNHICAPIKIIPLTLFDDKGIVTDDKNTIQIAAFDYNLVLCMISAFKARVDKDDDQYQYYNIMTSHLVYLRTYYFKKTGKTMLDETLFQEFITKCIGNTISPIRASRIEMLKRKSKHKLIVWKYAPESESRKENHTFNYKNSSGNAISNSNKLRVFKK